MDKGRRTNFFFRINYSKNTFLRFSMNLGKFINLVAPWSGSVHDSHIFRTSQIQEYIEHHHTSVKGGIMLGDSGFALKPTL